MFRKEQEVLHQIAKTSDAKRRKHCILKLGKEAAENILNETFKPIVTSLKTLVKMSDIPIKNEFKTKI